MSRWNEKQAKKAEFAINKMLDTGADSINYEQDLARDVRDAAMGKGDDELFEKKLSKEEKKALAKAKREAKKKVRYPPIYTSFMYIYTYIHIYIYTMDNTMTFDTKDKVINCLFELFVCIICRERVSPGSPLKRVQKRKKRKSQMIAIQVVVLHRRVL